MDTKPKVVELPLGGTTVHDLARLLHIKKVLRCVRYTSCARYTLCTLYVVRCTLCTLYVVYAIRCVHAIAVQYALYKF